MGFFFTSILKYAPISVKKITYILSILFKKLLLGATSSSLLGKGNINYENKQKRVIRKIEFIAAFIYFYILYCVF